MDPAIDIMPDFEGKAVTFYLTNVSPDCASTLDSPRFELHAGRLFAVGYSVSSNANDWTAGAYVCVAWDQVSYYIVFDSAEDFAVRVGMLPRGRGILGLFGFG